MLRFTRVSYGLVRTVCSALFLSNPIAQGRNRTMAPKLCSNCGPPPLHLPSVVPLVQLRSREKLAQTQRACRGFIVSAPPPSPKRTFCMARMNDHLWMQLHLCSSCSNLVSITEKKSNGGMKLDSEFRWWVTLVLFVSRFVYYLILKNWFDDCLIKCHSLEKAKCCYSRQCTWNQHYLCVCRFWTLKCRLVVDNFGFRCSDGFGYASSFCPLLDRCIVFSAIDSLYSCLHIMLSLLAAG